MQIVECWILARLRNHRFFSLAELNKAIGKLIVDLNLRWKVTLPGDKTITASNQVGVCSQPYRPGTTLDRKARLQSSVCGTKGSLSRSPIRPSPWLDNFAAVNIQPYG